MSATIKPAVCPRCSCLWSPTTAEKIAAKSETPPCWVCAWIASPEGQAAVAEEARLEEATAVGRIGGSSSSPGNGGTLNTSEAPRVDPGSSLPLFRETA